ncbi:MAG: PQQ-binding-like beta-propeller repeat protein, partial [Planctomycetales bacterium]|nr:PQQ-binding-like beta-propeller repeat protein [Planctomycetales bacterium]
MRSLLIALLVSPSLATAQDWPQWRGPTGDNHAAAKATAPTEWSEDANILWRTPVPGRGHSSPVIVGSRIYLTTGDREAQTQSLLVFDKSTGKLLKETVAHNGGLPDQIHGNNTHASPTVASDAHGVHALFYNSEGAWVSSFDFEGQKRWQQRVCEFAPSQFRFGFGSSPRVDNGVLIVSAEYDGPDSGVYGLDPLTGDQIWKAPRPEVITFSTPISATLGGQRQLLLTGAGRIASYDPTTG